MKKHSAFKRIIAPVISGAMLLNIAALPAETAAAFVWTGGTLINTDFDDGVGLPWCTYATMPARLKWDVSDGTYNIEIVNNGGANDGGADRWDCQFSHRMLEFRAGSTYHVHAEITADCDGEIFTKISALSGSKDLWLNAMGGTAEASYPGVEELGQAWDCLPVKKDEPLIIDAEFTCEKDCESAQWAFHFGGAGQYQRTDCFPDGTKLKFDNMQLYDVESGLSGSTSYSILYDPHEIAVNQLGYFTDGVKTAVLHRENPIEAEKVYLVEADTKEIAAIFDLAPADADSAALDPDSGRYVCQIDFSSFVKPGSYYFSFDGQYQTDSYTFRIWDDIYEGVMKDALNYFYQNRCGMPIEAEYITSAGENSDIADLAHAKYAENDTGYLQDRWVKQYTGMTDTVNETICSITAPGGWYEAANHTKSVPTGAYAAWLLQNLYEFSLTDGSAERFSEKAGEVITPEHNNQTPDILDECRYELDFLLDMTVPEELSSYRMQDTLISELGNGLSIYSSDSGQYTGMLFHAMTDSQNTNLAEHDWDYAESNIYREIKRIVKPPSTAATLAGAAVFAQGARLFREYDPEYADTLLNAAKTAYQAAKLNPDLWAPAENEGIHTFSDLELKDEFFWAACELYVTTGEQDYLTELEANPWFADGMPSEVSSETALFSASFKLSGSPCSFTSTNTAALGFLTLLLHQDVLTAEYAETLKQSVETTADLYLEHEGKNGFGVPYAAIQGVSSGGIGESTLPVYEMNSNGIITNNAILLAYAYQLTGEAKYRDGAVSAMNYIFGCNPMDTSYVTDCGQHPVRFPTHSFWAHALNSQYDWFPYAPAGVMVSGANSMLSDDFMAGLGMKCGRTAPQRCYVDDIEAWSVNSCGLDLNASLAWMMGFLSDGEASVPMGRSGDVNRDGGVNVSDAILLARILAEDTTVNAAEMGLQYADLNDNGLPDPDDLTLLLKRLAGLPD